MLVLENYPLFILNLTEKRSAKTLATIEKTKSIVNDKWSTSNPPTIGRKRTGDIIVFIKPTYVGIFLSGEISKSAFGKPNHIP